MPSRPFAFSSQPGGGRVGFRENAALTSLLSFMDTLQVFPVELVQPLQVTW